VPIDMLWWFERNGAQRTLEVLELSNGLYELRFTDSDDAERCESFGNPHELARRQQQTYYAAAKQKGGMRWLNRQNPVQNAAV